jgi:tape measure domain-containing protein
MAQMSLDTAIRLSAEVKGGGNIDRVKRSIQDLAQSSKTTAKDMDTLRSATFQLARANDGTIAGIKSSIGAFRGLQEQAKIGSREFQRYGAEIRKLEAKLNGLDDAARRSNPGLMGLAGAAKNLIAAYAGIETVRFVFGKTAELETQTRSLQVLTGSVERAKQIIQELQQLGAITPFTSTELIETAKRLQAFGVETANVVDTTRRLADVSGATGANLQELATAYGQVQAKGRLQGEELLQFQERGVALQEVLRKEYGLSGAEFQKALEKGQISAEAVEYALIKLTDTGGKYANGAIAQSTTLSGRLSTLTDGVEQLARSIGAALSPAIRTVLNEATFAVNQINQLIGAGARAKSFGLDQTQRKQLLDQATREAEDIVNRRNIRDPFERNRQFQEIRSQRERDLIESYGYRTGQIKPPAAAPQAISAPPPLTSSRAGGGGTAAAGGSSGSRKQAESLGAQIAKSLQQALKLSPAQAAGVVGNLMRESRLNPRVNEGGTIGLPRGVGGYGLAQWTGTRQQDLIRFAGGAAAAGNLQTQLRFLVSELMGPESKALVSLRRASSPEEAAVAFDRDYERSGLKALGERKANARRVFGEIAGSGAGAGLSDFANILEQQADAAEKLREQEQRIASIVRERSAEISLMGIKVTMEEKIADAQTQGDKLLERRLEGQQRQIDIQTEYAKLLADPANQDIRIQEILTTQGLIALKAEQVRTERELQAIERERAEEQRKSTPGFILGEAYDQSVKKLKDLTNAGNILSASADSIGSAFGSAFRDLITGATSASEALGRMFQSIADSFADMAAQMIAEWIKMQILGIVKSIFGAVAGGFSFGGSSGGFNLPGFEMPGYMAGTSIPSGFANGAAFDRGIVDSPTLFKFANGGAMRTGVMGEAGPEAILPLKRGVNGQLGVQMVGPAQQFAANRAALDGSTTGSGTSSPLAESRQALATAETSIRNRQADRNIEQAFSAPGQALKIQYDSQVINNVEYVTSDQFERGISQAAERGRALTLGALKNSVKARRQVGI